MKYTLRLIRDFYMLNYLKWINLTEFFIAAGDTDTTPSINMSNILRHIHSALVQLESEGVIEERDTLLKRNTALLVLVANVLLETPITACPALLMVIQPKLIYLLRILYTHSSKLSRMLIVKLCRRIPNPNKLVKTFLFCET